MDGFTLYLSRVLEGLRVGTILHETDERIGWSMDDYKLHIMSLHVC